MCEQYKYTDIPSTLGEGYSSYCMSVQQDACVMEINVYLYFLQVVSDNLVSDNVNSNNWGFTVHEYFSIVCKE